MPATCPPDLTPSILGTVVDLWLRRLWTETGTSAGETATTMGPLDANRQDVRDISEYSERKTVLLESNLFLPPFPSPEMINQKEIASGDQRDSPEV
jgi:hypothetical protein